MADKNSNSKALKALMTTVATQVVKQHAPAIAQKEVQKGFAKNLSFRSSVALATPKSGLEVANKDSAGDGSFLPITGGTLTGSVGFQKVGFNGTSPQNKPTVTGSKGGNAALASLIGALAAYGLIIDSTS